MLFWCGPANSPTEGIGMRSELFLGEKNGLISTWPLHLLITEGQHYLRFGTLARLLSDVHLQKALAANCVFFLHPIPVCRGKLNIWVISWRGKANSSWGHSQQKALFGNCLFELVAMTQSSPPGDSSVWADLALDRTGQKPAFHDRVRLWFCLVEDLPCFIRQGCGLGGRPGRRMSLDFDHITLLYLFYVTKSGVF